MGTMIKEKCYLYGSCKCQTAGCAVLPDEGCPVYRYFKDLIIKDYETQLKAEREKIAEDVAVKMDYIGSCLNEKNIILGIITGKRETTDNLCSTCKAESCVSNGTAISKADYNEKLKADMVDMLEELDLQIDESAAYNREVAKVQRLIRDKIDKLKENKGNDVKPIEATPQLSEADSKKIIKEVSAKPNYKRIQKLNEIKKVIENGKND